MTNKQSNQQPKIRQRRKNRRVRTVTVITAASMTKRCHKDECDINNILKGFQRTGLITHVRQSGGHYSEMPQAMDYQDACNLVLEAEASFADLPSSVRREFNNDPQEFLAFIENPANIDRMGELGLLNEGPPEPGPIDVNVVEKPSKSTPSTQPEGE